MSVKFEISFAKSVRLNGGLAILLKDTDSELPAGADSADPANVFAKAARIARFTAKGLSSLDIVAPEGSPVDRIFVIGTGKAKDLNAHDWLKLGGGAAAKIRNVDKVAIFIDVPGVEAGAKAAADFALGMLLHAYSFDTYKTKKNDDDDKNGAQKSVKVTIVTAECRCRQEALRCIRKRSPTALFSPAISSTSRRTFSVRSSSPPKPRSWKSSASKSRS